MLNILLSRRGVDVMCLVDYCHPGQIQATKVWRAQPSLISPSSMKAVRDDTRTQERSRARKRQWIASCSNIRFTEH
eukprot:6476555-Amphidinium_carterae.1